MKTRQQLLLTYALNLVKNLGFGTAHVGSFTDILDFLRFGFPDGNADLFVAKIKELPKGSEAIFGTNDSFLFDTIKSIDLQSDFLDTLAKNDTYQHLVLSSSVEEFPAAKLKFGKLIPLTNSYLHHLREQALKLHGEARKAIDIKIELVGTLEHCLDQSIPDSKIVKQFFTLLNKTEQQLVEHRDPEWQRYVRNVLIAGAILITGILPGLLALAIYVNVGNNEGKSYRFWQSTGENIVNQLKNTDFKVEEAKRFNEVVEDGTEERSDTVAKP